MFGKIVGAVTKPVQSVLGGILGGGSEAAGSAEASLAARQMAQENIERIKNLPLPDTEKMRLILEQEQFAPQIDAELLESSMGEQIQTDPMYREAMLKVLESGRNIGDLTDIGRQDITQQASSSLSQLVPNMDSESGASIAKMQSALGNVDDAQLKQISALAGNDMNMRRSALEGISSGSENILQSDFREGLKRSQARDLINEFNTKMSNQAQAANLANRQNILNRNVERSNQEQAYNTNLENIGFQNRMTKAGAESEELKKMAGVHSDAAKNQAAAEQARRAGSIGVLGSLGGLAGTLATGNPAVGAGITAGVNVLGNLSNR
jgi:hypothetical protein